MVGAKPGILEFADPYSSRKPARFSFLPIVCSKVIPGSINNDRAFNPSISHTCKLHGFMGAGV